MPGKVAYVLDFDGTITTKDISKELAIHYNEDQFWLIHNAYKKRELGMRDWLKQSAALLPSDYDQLITTALSYAVVRPGFNEFIDYANVRSRPVVIASDGFGFYIEPILESVGTLNKITKIYRNELEIKGQCLPSVKYVHAHNNCKICGNCKANHVNELKSNGFHVIFVGDGTNDIYGASASNYIAARDRLADLCSNEKLSYHSWEDYFDLVSVSDLIVSQGFQGPS